MMTKTEFEKLHFCTRYWDENGGNPRQRPYWDVIGGDYVGRRQRVYLNTSWYRTWEEFAPAAERAVNAALMKFDAVQNTFVKSGASYSFSGDPHYMIEQKPWPGSTEYDVWINCLCPDEEQFLDTLSIARKRVENLKSGEIKPGFRVASLFEPQPPAPQYPTAWCQSAEADNSVSDLLKRKGIR